MRKIHCEGARASRFTSAVFAESKHAALAWHKTCTRAYRHQSEPYRDMEQTVVRDQELIGTLQRYADLFTFAPVGALILTEVSRVEVIHRTAASLLEQPRVSIA